MEDEQDLEAYLEDDREITHSLDIEEIEDDIEEEITLHDILFQNKTLQEYVEEFTITLPNLPCSSQEITQKVIDLNNSYQRCYNAYNTLVVLCSKIEKELRNKKDSLIAKKIESLREAAPGKRLPGKETIEAMISDSDSLKFLINKFELYNSIKVFFESNKTKLEKSMTIAKDIMWSATSSDRVTKMSGGHGYGIS